MTVLDGWHVVLIAGTASHGFVIDPTRYTYRLVTPITPGFNLGKTRYSEFSGWSVEALDAWNSGVGWDKFNVGPNYAYGVDGRSGALVLGPAWDNSATFSGAVVKLLPYTNTAGAIATRLYAICEGTVPPGTANYYNPATETWVQSTTFSRYPTDAEVAQGKLWVCFGVGTSSNSNISRFDGNAWATISAWASGLCRVGQTLWRSTGTAVSSWTGASFSTDIPVGEASTMIQSLAAFEGTLYVRKPEGLFYILNGTSSEQLLSFYGCTSTIATKMLEWQNSLYMAIGHSLWRYRGGVVSDISPQAGTYQEGSEARHGEVGGPMWGRVTAMAASPTSLYVLVTNSGGQRLYVTNGSSWHCWDHSTAGAGRAMTHVQGLSDSSPADARYLFVCGGSAGAQVNTYILPAYSDDFLNESVPRRISSGEDPAGVVVMPWFDGGLALVDKYWKSVDIACENITSTDSYIKVHYLTETSGQTWTYAGMVNTPTRTEVGLGVQSKRIALRLALYNTSTANSPIIIRALVLNYLSYISPRLRGFIFPIKAGGERRKTDGTADTRSADTIQGTLKTLWETKGPLNYLDFLGNSASVNIVNVVPTVIRGEDGADADVYFTVHVVEVPVDTATH